MNEFLNKNKIRLVVLALAVVMLITSASYAWFSSTVSGDGNENVVTAGNMEITFEDGQVIGTPSNMIPGQEITKDFTIRNTGNVDTEYVIYLSEVINTFNPTSDLEYKLETLDTAGYETSGFVTAPTSASAINSTAQTLLNQGEHAYRLTIRFKETNANQNSNKGKKFQAKIQVNEVEDAMITITYDAVGGTSSKSSEQVVTQSSLESLPAATKAQDASYNYNFVGWFDKETGGNEVTTSTVFKDNITLYAHWQIIPRTCLASRSNEGWTADYTCTDGTSSGTNMVNCYYQGVLCDGGNTGDYGRRLEGCKASPGERNNYAWYVCKNTFDSGLFNWGPGLYYQVNTFSCSCDPIN